MTTIAVIGLGNMGGPMAQNLVKAGHGVTGFDLSPAAIEEARAGGVAIAKSVAEAVKGAEAIVTMLPAGKHVRAVWGEIVGLAAKGTLLIDSSTIDVESARAVHAQAEAAGLVPVDAPVSGGVGGARRPPSPSCVAARMRPLPAQSRSLKPWARRSCIAAAQARVRRRRSATT